MKTHVAAIVAALVGSVALQAWQPAQVDRTAWTSNFEAMAAAERAFAKAAFEKGIRDAFVEYFADDSIGFYPRPVNAREFYRKLEPLPLTRRLEWEPRLGDVAASGDLGWLTGPFKSYDTATEKPPRFGCYFSIWRKQGDGSWKVLMDVGVPTPEPVVFSRSGLAGVAEVGDRFVERDWPRSLPNVVKADVTLARDLETGTPAHAYNTVLTPVSRLHVPNRAPLEGAKDILAWVQASSSTLKSSPEAGDVARSMDLAFTRGSYEETRAGAEAGGAAPGGQSIEKGYYVRMWKRATDQRWTLAVEVRSPLPPEK